MPKWAAMPKQSVSTQNRRVSQRARTQDDDRGYDDSGLRCVHNQPTRTAYRHTTDRVP